MMMLPLPSKVLATWKSFNISGRCMSPRGVHELSADKYEAAFLYVLTNMPEMDDFFQVCPYSI